MRASLLSELNCFSFSQTKVREFGFGWRTVEPHPSRREFEQASSAPPLAHWRVPTPTSLRKGLQRVCKAEGEGRRIQSESGNSEEKYPRQRSSPKKTLRLKLAEGLTILLQIFLVVGMVVDTALPKKAVKLEARKPQQLGRLIMRKRSRAVSLDSESLQSNAPGVGLL